MAHILLVEDERHLATLVSNWLQREQYQVDTFINGDAAIAQLRANPNKYSLLILDIMLPGKKGTDVCSWYRNHAGKSPILMLTALDDIDDKVSAFKLGADDYLTKPFQLKELAIRVEALLRRSGQQDNRLIVFDDITIDLFACTVTKADKAVHLSPKEFQLLELFARNPSRVYSSHELLHKVWEPESDALEDTIRGHVNRLRRKLDTPGKPSCIQNVYGFGYKLEIESQKA